jgi:CRP/FNR family cyclic AMP-dependent transcriptional regulator
VSIGDADSTRPVTLGPFADLPDAQRRAVLALANRRRLLAGQRVFRAGDRADHVIVVQSGLVSVQVAGPSGRQLILAMFGEDDVLGEMALAGVPRRTATVVAVRDSEVLMLDARRLHELRAATREVDLAVMGVLADTVRRLTNQLLEATLISQPVRLRRILLRLHRHYDAGRIALTHDDLADMLGARRTTVTELLAAEVEAGRVVKGRGYVQIVDLAAMREASR